MPSLILSKENELIGGKKTNCTSNLNLQVQKYSGRRTDDIAFVTHNNQDSQEIITHSSKSTKAFGPKSNLKKQHYVPTPSEI